jgi:hypothetical protein
MVGGGRGRSASTAWGLVRTCLAQGGASHLDRDAPRIESHRMHAITFTLPLADLTVDLTALGRAYDNLGQRGFFGTGQTVNCAVDLTGIPTEVSSAGNERWVGVSLRFRRAHVGATSGLRSRALEAMLRAAGFEGVRFVTVCRAVKEGCEPPFFLAMASKSG